MELFGQLGIEWKLLLAQAVNFLLLVFILNKVLYKPIRRMLDERKAKAEAIQLEHSKMEERKKQFDQWTEGQVTDARRKSELIVVEAEKFAGRMKTKKLDDLSVERQKALLEVERQLDRDRKTLERELRTSISQESAKNVFSFFQELGSEQTIHPALVEKTITELAAIPFDKTQMKDVVQVEIASARALTKSEKEKLQKTLEKAIGHALKITQSTSAKLIAGVKVTVGGFELDGSIVGRLKRKTEN